MALSRRHGRSTVLRRPPARNPYRQTRFDGLSTFPIFVVSGLLTLLVNMAGSGHEWLSFIPESKAAIATLGAFYSFAIVFRTHICYGRWWEGRQLWGTLIVNCVRIAQQANLWIKDEALAHRLRCLSITFAYACKAQLRGNSIIDEEEDGAKLVLRGVLSQEELNMIATQRSWQPYYCIEAMRATMEEGLLESPNRGEAFDWVKNSAHQAMEDTICNLATTVGGCIRVKSTGLPLTYDVIMHKIGALFFVAASIAWAPGSGWLNPFAVVVIYSAIAMIMTIGSSMEDPFGKDESDLPLDNFCSTVEEQVNAIRERDSMLTYSLARGPEARPTVSRGKYPSYLSMEDEKKISEETDPLLTTALPL